MKKLLSILALSLCAIIQVQAQEGYNCFGIIAGKDATADGSVLMGHNEDDDPEQMLNIYLVGATDAVKPGMRPDGTPIKLYGTSSASYIWAEFPRMDVADSFINEHGVCVASDGCPSCEDTLDTTDGGVLYDIRVNVAMFAHSSREAVEIIGSMVEKYGYAGSGRTYLVADPDEGWLVSVVQGRHWVAQRVPDDKVVAIPNHYIIDKVDLSDTDNFAGSADLVEYATARGWYDPQTDGEFSFRKAYSRESTKRSDSNRLRRTAVLNILTGLQLDGDTDNYEFAYDPAHKLTVQDIMQALSSHSTSLSYLHDFEYDPQRHPAKCSVCNNNTILSSVFQLRSWLPRRIGCIMWNAMGHPCSEVYIPWYLGIRKVPQGWGRYATAEEAGEKHFSDTNEMQVNHPDGNYWKYTSRWENVAADYAAAQEGAATLDEFQQKIFEEQAQLDARLTKKFVKRNGKLRRQGKVGKIVSKWLEERYAEYDQL